MYGETVVPFNLALDPTRSLQWLRDSIKDWHVKNPDFAHAMLRAIDGYQSGSERRELPVLLCLREYPVSVEEFLFSQDYLWRPRDELYPVILEEMIRLNNPDQFRVVNPYTEAILTGGIGSGKTTIALLTQLYQLYVLSCLRNPHRALGLDTASEILFVLQSASGGLAKAVDYQRMRMLAEQSPFFTKKFPFDKQRLSEMIFPQRIIVKPIGTDTGAIGQNVISGVIDELNFMAVIQQSKRSHDQGTYNQAMVVYEGITRRRKSRFSRGGALPGILCLVSSKRYPGEFTDVKIEEARRDKSIYVYDKRVWDVKPPGSFGVARFRVFPGTVRNKARILDDKEKMRNPEDEKLVIRVPLEFRREFEGDIIGSLRDIAGVSTLARSPYFSNTEAVAGAFEGPISILSVEEADMVESVVEFIPSRFKDLHRQRWVHVDLGLTSDAAGVACGYVDKFVISQNDPSRVLPHITFDFILRVVPPIGGEIQFHKIRTLLIKLREFGLPIRWVTFDTYQSTDSIQLLRRAQFETGHMPLDKNADPYVLAKSVVYDGRAHAPPHATCRKELCSVEQSKVNGRIDHPVDGSKDCADAFCSVVYGLSTARAVWHSHGHLFDSSSLSQLVAVRTRGPEEGEID